MINAATRTYDYYTIGNKNAYGQQSANYDAPAGKIKIAIFTTAQSVQDNVRYKDASYVGLTMAADINDTFIIQYGSEKLKVLYVNTQGRFKQVFLKNI